MSQTGQMSRADIRGKIFSTKPKSKVVTFEGIEVEIRQPSVGEILAGLESSDRKAATVQMLINYCYVPGTSEKVFEAADAELLLGLPFGEQWMALTNAIDELTNLTKIKEEERKNFSDSPGEKQS